MCIKERGLDRERESRQKEGHEAKGATRGWGFGHLIICSTRGRKCRLVGGREDGADLRTGLMGGIVGAMAGADAPLPAVQTSASS
jgi:hypothetical protein